MQSFGPKENHPPCFYDRYTDRYPLIQEKVRMWELVLVHDKRISVPYRGRFEQTLQLWDYFSLLVTGHSSDRENWTRRR